MFKDKQLLTLADLSTEEILTILELGHKLKTKQKKGKKHNYLQGKVLGMIFEKASTRTRVSFEVGMYQLGGQAIFLSNRDMQLSRGEPIKDTARVLSRYVDGVMIRTFAHSKLEEFANYSSVPVINGLTDDFHPCQVLADMMTIQECFGKDLKGLKIAFLGDGNNMAQSLLNASVKLGMDISIASPKGYAVKDEVLAKALAVAKKTKSKVELLEDPEAAAKGADVLITDVWASMGQEAEQEERAKHFKPYQINEGLLSLAHKKVEVLHCLPAHREEEITDTVFEKFADTIFEEAENRLHAQKAVMTLLMS